LKLSNSSAGFSVPIFFFHLIYPGNYCADEVGGEFPDVEAAYLDAWQAALEMSFDMLRERRDPNQHHFEIVDEKGQFLLEILFSEVMRPTVRPTNNLEVRTVLRQRLQRSRELRADIKNEFDKTRLVLKSAHATLDRARSRS
jgi:hypothetical protein